MHMQGLYKGLGLQSSLYDRKMENSCVYICQEKNMIKFYYETRAMGFKNELELFGLQLTEITVT